MNVLILLASMGKTEVHKGNRGGLPEFFRAADAAVLAIVKSPVANKFPPGYHSHGGTETGDRHHDRNA